MIEAGQKAQRAAERAAKAEADQAEVHKEISAVREDAAQLRGQVDAMQRQAADLMRAFSDRQAPPAADGKPAVKSAKGKMG